MLPLVIVVIAAVGFVGYRITNNSKDKTSSNTKTNSANKEMAKSDWPSGHNIEWSSDGHGGWITLPYDSKAPACPDPLVLNLPTTDIDQATSILYPGQSRSGSFEGLGGTYKAHGGIRFDKSKTNEIKVVMPFNGSVTRASNLLIEGEKQYGFDIVNECGIMIRLGHLHDLTPDFQKIADKAPVGGVNNSQTTKISPSVAFKVGDVIATVVGFKNTNNTGFDYGVYDLRSNNQASKDPAYQAAHKDTAETAYHGLCWPNNLSAKDMKTVKALPGGDGATGKTSDYCK